MFTRELLSSFPVLKKLESFKLKRKDFKRIEKTIETTNSIVDVTNVVLVILKKLVKKANDNKKLAAFWEKKIKAKEALKFKKANEISFYRKDLAKKGYLLDGGAAGFGYSVGETELLTRIQRGVYKCNNCSTQFATSELKSARFDASKKNCIENCFKKFDAFEKRNDYDRAALLRKLEAKKRAADEVDAGFLSEACGVKGCSYLVSYHKNDSDFRIEKEFEKHKSEYHN